MDRERPPITVLIVDHDEVALACLANMLMAQQYRVQTAKNAHDALVTLRSNEGLFDIIITEFHVLGMDGFDFQNHIRDQFQIPIIMVSKDNRQHIVSKTLENGAAHFILKPICAEDLNDIWKYVDEAKKHKLFIENLFIESEEQETSEQPKTDKIDCKGKSIDGYEGEGEKEGECQVIKKKKLVWTPHLHKLFVDAIKQIGLGKVVPLKILEIMNVPELTRENVASHLQKYRVFMRDVAKKGMIGGMSHRASKSMFASSLPASVIREIQEMRTKKLCAPKLNHGVEIWNLESLRNSSILPHNVTCDARNNNPFGNQFINSGSEMVGNGTMNEGGFNSVGMRVDTTNRNNFGLNVGGQNANMNFGSLAYENFGLVQGGFGSGSVSYGMGGNVSDFQAGLVNQGNVSYGNVVENQQNYNGGTLTNADEFNQMEFNNFDFSTVDDNNLLNEIHYPVQPFDHQ